MIFLIMNNFRKILDSIADCIHISSPDYKIEYMNKAMENRIGKLAIGEKCFKVFHCQEKRCDWCEIGFNGFLDNHVIEKKIVSPLDQKTFRVSISPFPKKDGSVSILETHKDITQYLNIFSERELLKQQLIQAQKMEAIGVLSSGIAHEFNNILFSIMANAELCFSELNDHDPRNEYIEAILNGGNRAKELISNILSFNKKNKYNRYPILLKPVISETLKLLTPSIPSNINIVINMYEEEDYVFIGKTEVYEIIMNLCLNSFQSMEKKSGTVKIGLDRVYPSPHVNLPFKEFCRIKIEDNGIGIQPDILQMIFKPFFTTKKNKGTGLGLSVVQEIVDKAKGAIDLQSRIGIGTTMNVLLPITNIK